MSSPPGTHDHDHHHMPAVPPPAAPAGVSDAERLLTVAAEANLSASPLDAVDPDWVELAVR